MILLLKVSKPVKAKDTRPISISSATERLFSRMVLRRCKEKLQLKYRWQCAGPNLQTADYIHAFHKLVENEREWGRGLAVLKVDIAKALHTVCRRKLMRNLRDRLGDCEELKVWHTLLRTQRKLFAHHAERVPFKPEEESDRAL